METGMGIAARKGRNKNKKHIPAGL